MDYYTWDCFSSCMVPDVLPDVIPNMFTYQVEQVSVVHFEFQRKPASGYSHLSTSPCQTSGLKLVALNSLHVSNTSREGMENSASLAHSSWCQHFSSSCHWPWQGSQFLLSRSKWADAKVQFWVHGLHILGAWPENRRPAQLSVSRKKSVFRLGFDNPCNSPRLQCCQSLLVTQRSMWYVVSLSRICVSSVEICLPLVKHSLDMWKWYGGGLWNYTTLRLLY